MSDPRLVTLAAAVIKKAIAEADSDARERLLMMLEPGDRKTVWVHTPDGPVDAGTVTLTKPSKPKRARRVTDRDAFLAYVKEHRPDEVIHTEAVRSSYEAAVLARPEADDNGEVIDNPPGVEWVESTTRSVVQVRPSEDAAAAIAAAVQAGSVSLHEVLALPGGAS